MRPAAGAVILGAFLVFGGTAAMARWAPEIAVTGNARTRDGYLADLVRDCLDEQGAGTLAGIDRPALEQCVLDSELFSQVAVTVDTAVRVAVEERWTLIPVPFFQSQGDDRRGGLFVIESNFLGRGKLLVAGATLGNRGNTALLVLQDPGVAFGDATAQAVFRRGDEDVLRREGDAKVDGYRLRETVVKLQPGYRLTPQLQLDWELGFADRRYGAADDFPNPPGDDRFWATGPGLEWDATRFRFFYREGHALRAELQRQFLRRGGSPATTYQWQYDGQFPWGGEGVAKLQVAGRGTGSRDRRDAVREGGQGALRGVEREGLWARHLAGVSVDYHYPLWRRSYGTWAAGPFAAYARYRPPEGGSGQTSRAWGAGVFLFLRKVAIPGVGLVVGHNPMFGGGFVDVQVGFGF